MEAQAHELFEPVAAADTVGVDLPHHAIDADVLVREASSASSRVAATRSAKVPSDVTVDRNSRLLPK